MAEQKGKYQPWSHEEFMADRKVRRMSPLAAKTYMMLLHEAFVCETRPNLPDDDNELYYMAYCTDRAEWESVKDVVLDMFRKETVDGRDVLVNKRLVSDWSRLREIREARSEAGKASAAKRKSTCVEQVLTNEHKEVKEVSNEREVSEEREEILPDSAPSFETDGQENDVKLKDELTKIAAQHGAKAGGFKTTWDKIKTLGVSHGTGAVATDFAAYMEEFHGDDFPSGAVVAYLDYAEDRLTASSAPAAALSKDPRIAEIMGEIAYLSGDKVIFHGKHLVQLAGLLEDHTVPELLSVFKTFVEMKDLEDSYTLKFIAQNYLDGARSLAYSARKRKQEHDKTQAARDAKALQMQEEAESERKKAEAARAEEESFDPLSGLV